MVIATVHMVATIILAVVLLAYVLKLFFWDMANICNYFFALGAGAILSLLLIFILPAQLSVASSAYYLVIGVLLMPLLHLAFQERQSEDKKVKRPLAGILTWLRIAVLALLYGIAIAMIGVNVTDVTVLTIITFFVLTPEFANLYALLHYEGSRKKRAAIITALLSVLPLVAAIAVGVLFNSVLPDLGAPFICVALGTMIYMAIADRLAGSLKRGSWSEIALAFLGAAIAAAVVTFL